MSKKVVYVSWVRLTDKYARDWYIDHLIKNGIEVEYWDIVALTREYHNEVGELYPNYLRILQSYAEFEKLVQLNENSDAIYVMLINPSWRTRLPFKILSKYNRRMAYINWGSMPLSSVPKLKKALSTLIGSPYKFFELLFGMVAWEVYKNLRLVKPFDVVFSAGSGIAKSDQFAKEVVNFNLCDYDNYLRAKVSKKPLVKGKYAVFLDINLPFQSDLAVVGLQALSAKIYYQSLNRFFALLEQKYNLKIVIAAHPKSMLDKTLFGSRENYRLCTAELVKDADFVVAHHSTALSYAVLNLKPCFFIYTDEMSLLYQDTIVRWLYSLASFLDSPIYNIDKIINDQDITLREPNINRYDDFKYSYLTSQESEGQLSKNIFLKKINSIS